MLLRIFTLMVALLHFLLAIVVAVGLSKSGLSGFGLASRLLGTFALSVLGLVLVAVSFAATEEEVKHSLRFFAPDVPMAFLLVIPYFCFTTLRRLLRRTR